MITYRCPGCGKQHSRPAPFDAPCDLRCLRCGRSFPAPADLIAAPVSPPAGAPPGQTAAGPAGAITTAPAAAGATAITDAPPASAARKKAPARSPAPALDADDALDADQNAPFDQDARDADGPPDKKGKKKDKTGGGSVPPWKNPTVLGGAGAALLIVGVGGYFLFGRPAPKKLPPPPPIAQGNPNPHPAPPVPTPPQAAEKDKEKDKPKGTETPPAVRKAAFRLSAARLAAELTRDKMAADRSYKGAVVEVSGRLEKLTPPNPAGKPPGYEARFLVLGTPVICDLPPAPPNLAAWQAVPAGEPFTVRADYMGEGILRQCELVTVAPPADGKYRGSDLEVVGTVDEILLTDGGKAEFPTVRLHGGTGNPARVECLFRKSDEAVVKRLEVGGRVTVLGTGGGRVGTTAAPLVRLDNCQVVDTSAPAGQVPRLPAPALVREYTEDLAVAHLPPWGAEPVVPGTLTLEKLNRDLRIDPVELHRRLRLHRVTVSGKVARRENGEVVLDGPGTADKLKVSARFDPHNFKITDGGPDLTVRGVCSGLTPEGTVRLDDCEVIEGPVKRDPRRITADYLPFTAGKQLTYDLVTFPTPGVKKGPEAVRAVLVCLKEGSVESVTTHKGPFLGRTLLDPKELGDWVRNRMTKAIRQPGPSFQHRITPTYVEVGEKRLTAPGKVETLWEPVLGLGARTGDTWTWTEGLVEHQYKVVGFSEYRERPAVTIQQRIESTLATGGTREVRVVYVKGVGMVERQEVQFVTSEEKRVLAEKRLVLVNDASPFGPEPPAKQP